MNKSLYEKIDPNGKWYTVDDRKAAEDMGVKVASIIPDPGDFNYAKKGDIYDPYCRDLILGAGGQISDWKTEQNTDNDLIIRGLGGTSQKALKQCMDIGRTFYAIDTGYIQPAKRKEYHRVTKNALQNLGPIKDRPTDRMRKLGWEYRKPTGGSYILVCPPSEKVMKFYGKNLDEWMKQTLDEIKSVTNAPIKVRLKPSREDRVNNDTIWQALDDAICLVTYNSIAATEALLYSVPSIALAPNAATVLCNTSIKDIPNNLNLPTKEELVAFVKHLSYCQFTAAEMANGLAWSILNEGS